MTECGLKATDELFDIDRLAEEGESAAVHGSFPCALIFVGGHEDHRWALRKPVQFSLQLDPAKAGHLHIDEHAVDCRAWFEGEKLLRRRKQAAVVATGLDEVIHRFSDGVVVIDDGYGRYRRQRSDPF